MEGSFIQKGGGFHKHIQRAFGTVQYGSQKAARNFLV